MSQQTTTGAERTHQGPRPQAGASGWLPRAGLAVLVLLGGMFFVWFSTQVLGAVHGVEFSPDTFRRRSFTYYQVPLLGIQLSPVVHQDQTANLESHLVRKGYIPVDKKAEPRWDLVLVVGGATRVQQGDASILCTYLDLQDSDGNLSWLEWTQEHPSLAKILWPAVARVTRQQRYMLVPDLLRLAELASEPEPFQEELDALLARRYWEMANFAAAKK